ncbi:site-specific integrase [Rhodococcus sovatensis]|uniref:Site-specific integrase n=1 Tax=Rhodococcus sovatensis TaxID=1805840 RepID=A0ABZ2PNE6_9NOCA
MTVVTLETRLKEMMDAGKQKPQTIWGYEKFLKRIGAVDNTMDRYQAESRLFALTSANCRRSTIIALRSVWGIKIPIPAPTPRRYELPSEESLRFVAMQSSHETRILTMMYEGLRLGEAAALTGTQLRKDRLLVDRQVIELSITADSVGGRQRIVRIGPPKYGVAEVTVPNWLQPRIEALTATVLPTSIQTTLQKASKKTGIKVNPHLLRHWLCTDLIDKGVPLPLVQKQMRHKRLETTIGIYHEYQEELLHTLYDKD